MHLQKPIVVRSLSHFRSYIEGCKPLPKCISFDIFDTLIQRCIEPPEQIHLLVANIISKKIKIKTPSELVRLRNDVVNTLRISSGQKGNDLECKFDEIIHAWVKSILGRNDDILYNFIRDTELSLESSALLVKPQTIQTLKWLHLKNIKVIAISDMYLSEFEIRNLFKNLKIEKYFHHIFVSSDYGLSKGSGRLHEYVLRKMNINPSEIIHIGDNIISDMWSPLKLGMKGVFLNERKSRFRRIAQSISSNLALKNNFWKGYKFFEIIKTRLNTDPIYSKNSKDFYYKYGSEILGPAFSCFTLGIIEKNLEIKPDRIFFLARDGYMFFHLAKSWFKTMPSTEDSNNLKYIYVSRKVVASASVANGLTLDQARIPLYNPKQKGLRTILNAFGLEDERFYELKALDKGFGSLNEPIYDFNDPRLVKFLEDEEVQELITKTGKHSLSLFEEYFEQIGFFESKKVAIVDIGWNGTIQKFLNDCFSTRKDFPELHGWYFAFVPNMHGPVKNAFGLMSEGNGKGTFDSAPQEFEEIFEQAAKSNEPTTVSFRKKDGKIIPILKDNKCLERIKELRSDSFVASIQKGIHFHMNHFIQAYKLTGYSFEQLKPYVSCLIERAIVYPNNEEVQNIANITHSEDFGQNDLLDLSGKYLGFYQLFRFSNTLRKLKKNANRYAVFGPFPSILRGFILRIIFIKKIF